jgi:hypothetical protein
MYTFRLSDTAFPEQLEEFSRATRVTRLDDTIEITFPWSACIKSVDGVDTAEIKRCLSGVWEPFRCSNDETQQGTSLEPPVLATALRVPDSATRREVTLDSEVFATKAFGNRWRLDVNKLIAGQPSFQRFQGYRIVNPTSNGEFSALAISRANGQFGHNFKQLINAIQLYTHLAVDRVYVPKLSQFEVAGGRVKIRELEFVSYQRRGEIVDAALFGTYFYKDSFGNLLNAGAMEQQRLVDTYIRPLFVPSRAVEQRPPHHIAIHIRSSDLFNRPNPHPRYPQPPLAFYKQVLAHFRRAHANPHVSLVYQDDANPVIRALEQYLSAEGTSFTTHSCTLQDDLSVLMGHQTVVFGRGTFGKAVVSLAPHIKCVYFPWTDTDFRFILRAKSIAGYCVTEIEQRYIAVGAWANTPSQREQMIEYPVDNLIVAPCQV